MTVPIDPALLFGLLCGSTVGLLTGVVGYRTGRELLGRTGAIAGFALLAVLMALLAVVLAAGTRDYRYVAAPTSLVGVLFSYQAIRLTATGWHRSEQLATTTAVLLAVVLPFELDPSLHVLAQEIMANHVATVVRAFGADPALRPTPQGHLVRVVLPNDGYIEVVRECNGVYAIALFGAVVTGARTTLPRKMGGIAFVLAAVYLVNVSRMSFVALALAGDWFGPLVTDTNTIQVTYYVAEMGIGQLTVVVASVVGYLVVGRWIPDVIAFASDLFETATLPSLP